MSSIAVIGEAVADAVAQPVASGNGLRLDVRPGGSPVNTSVALSRLGTPTRYFGRLSRGVLGQMLRRHLEESGVNLTGTVSVPYEATLAIASVDPAGRADYDFYTDGTADWDWRADELTTLGTSPLIHTGSLALVRSPAAEVIVDRLRELRRGSTVSIDPNVRPVAPARRYRSGLAEWAKIADILKLSSDDIEFTYPGGVDYRRLCDRWHSQGCRLVVITLGDQGAVASLDGETTRVAAREVNVVDTIGAGDAFTAGLLHRLHADGHAGGLDRLDMAGLVPALDLATTVAAATCEVPGADPPWMDAINPR